MPLHKTKRICLNLPANLLDQLDMYVAPSERSELVADLLEEYVAALQAEDDQIARVEARREQMQLWAERLRDSGRKAADMFLP